MSTQIPADEVEEIVGAARHEYLHVANFAFETLTLNILHPRACRAAYDDLRDCPYSVAMDKNLEVDEGFEFDQPIFAVLEEGRLVPWSPSWTSPI